MRSSHHLTLTLSGKERGLGGRAIRKNSLSLQEREGVR
jgi:hypothetical protein